MPNSNPKIGLQEIGERIEFQSQDSYVEWIHITKNVTWLLAATTLIAILFSLNGADRAERIIYFAATVLQTFIPVVTYSRGLLFHAQRQNFFDEVWPATMGFIAIWFYLALAVGMPIVLPYDNSTMFGLPFNEAWFWLTGSFAATASCLVLNRLVQTRVSDFDERLEPLVRDYRGQILGDLLGSVAFAIGGFAVAVNFDAINGWRFPNLLSQLLPNGGTAMASLFGIMALFVSLRASGGREKLRRMFRAL